MTRRQLRHLLLAGLVALACVIAFGLTAGRPSPTFALSLGLGYASLALLIGALATGPLTAIRGRRVPVSTMFRRDLGIWAGIAGLLHVVFGLQSHHGGRIVRYFIPDSSDSTALLFVATNWIGLAATAILIGLLLLSNNRALRILGPARWKFWQRFTYLLGLLTIAHTFGYQVLESRSRVFVLLAILALGGVVVLQVLGYWRVRQQLRLRARG